MDYHYWDARRVANGRKISPLRKEKGKVAVWRKRARFGGRQDVNVMEKERGSGEKIIVRCQSLYARKELGCGECPKLSYVIIN